MKALLNKISYIVVLYVFLCLNAFASQEVDTLDKLMRLVDKAGVSDEVFNRQREKEFLEKRNKRSELLQSAKSELKRIQIRNSSLKSQFDKGEQQLTKLQDTLHQRAGSLGELFGVVRQVAGETSAVFEHSIISSQITNRLDIVRRIADSKSLPSIYHLEKLWAAMQKEMIETGNVVTFTGDVINPDGTLKNKEITRIGVFNAISEGKFLRYHSDSQSLYEVVGQPINKYETVVSDFEQSNSGLHAMVIDPSRGVILDLYGLTPGFFERISQGKLVGYIIIALGCLGLLLLLERFIVLFKTENKLKKQLLSDTVDSDNALGRILNIYKKNLSIDLDALERKIDEAIITEVPVIERGLSTIKILAVIAPLLGLLGTVTGMIETFQSITLFGTGDAKLMAGGISQALITTVLGLVVAIPLILLHSIASNKSKRCINILESQSAGLIATHAESKSSIQ